MSRRPRSKGDIPRKDSPHYRLHKWLVEKPAWKALNGNEKAIYADIGIRYRGPGSNNGKISYSIREAAACARIGKSTAAKCLLRLQELGFIVAMRSGAFDWKAGMASEWRLTEFVCDVTRDLPTKEFLRWQPGATFLPPRPERPPKKSKPGPAVGTDRTSRGTEVYLTRDRGPA